MEASSQIPNPEDEEEAKAFEWKDVPNANKAKVAVGTAVDDTWKHAKKEINYVKQQVKDKCKTQSPQFHHVFDLVFGEQSDLYDCFKKADIFDDHKEFLLFLATFLTAAS